MIKIIIFIVLLVVYYLIFYKKVIIIFKSAVFVLFFVFLILCCLTFLWKFVKFLNWIIFFYVFFKDNKKNEQKLTDWEVEFQKEKEKEAEMEELERIREEKAFKKNRNERRKRRKIKYETVEYPGEKYHPDYDGIYFFYERFQDGIWRTKNARYFRSKFKIYFPFFLLFVFTFLAWLLNCLNNIDFIVYNIDNFYVKIDNQFVHLSKRLVTKKGTKFLTVVNWDDQKVNRYLILKNGKFRKCESFFLTELPYNWMFQKDARSKKFPFKFYNWVYYQDNIMICKEKFSYIKKITRRKKRELLLEQRYRGPRSIAEWVKSFDNPRRYGYRLGDKRVKFKIKILDPNRKFYSNEDILRMMEDRRRRWGK